MKTYIECIPCFLNQSLEMAKLVTGNEIIQKEVLDEVAKTIPSFDLGCKPPEMARLIRKVIEKKMGEIDFYKSIKEKSNKKALELYPQLKKKVNDSYDRLLTAVEIAIAGNVIDYASKNTLDIDKEIEQLFANKTGQAARTIFDYADFVADLKMAKVILYIADNAGEIVFDKVLIEEINKDKKIFFALRDKPVINDALVEDAIFCGLDKVSEVISSGVDAPGAILKYCSSEFRELFKKADMVISKGQGNYEALNDENRTVYFMFRAKCPVIARHAAVVLGDIVLKKS